MLIQKIIEDAIKLKKNVSLSAIDDVISYYTKLDIACKLIRIPNGFIKPKLKENTINNERRRSETNERDDLTKMK